MYLQSQVVTKICTSSFANTVEKVSDFLTVPK